MITMEQARMGFCKYAECELAKKKSGLNKWNAAFLAVPLSMMLQEKLLANRDIAQKAGYMSEDGLIDIDKVYNEYHDVALRMGPTVHYLPLFGDVQFTADDVTSLYNYMVH